MSRLLFLICFLFSSLGFSAPITCPDNRCIAVVNAGNSGSRLHVYSYELDASNTPYNIKNVFSKKIEPGFASVELHQSSIDRYLSQLFSDTPEHAIPVYFYATSGMRMLNFCRQQAYYAKLSQWFSEQTQWQLVVAKTLKNREEAMYGWLAVNYELGTLSSDDKPLVGVVDSGSASVQIAFPLSNLQTITPDDYININVYGRHIPLYTHGFIGLGQDEIRNQFLDDSVCFPKHYPLPNGSTGTGDFMSCAKLMTPLINDIHQVDSTVKAAMEDNQQQTWYVIGGISDMLQERPFSFEHHEFTNEEFAEKTNHLVCQQDWAVIGTLYPENRHLYANCLNASYFYSLFVDGFGISQTHPIHYLSKKTSTNDWTIGVILQEGRL